MHIIHGERIGKTATLMVGCAAVIFDKRRETILLTRRADNGRWCLPGGRMEPGETAAEACEREVLEETGRRVKVSRLVGIYTDPNLVIQYKDSDTFQIIAMCFEAIIISGEVGLSNETTEAGWFTPSEIATIDLVDHHPQRIADAIANRETAFIR
jgi:8-oxo-dGTP pyrophosphatase MutT (NUDIX family)